MIAIVDYGVGNLFSLTSSFAAIGVDAVATGDAEVIKSADKIVLPGVGAFGDAIKKLRESGLDKVIMDQVGIGVPLMGICLGMQLLFQKSHEYGLHEGLGLLDGEIRPISEVIPCDFKVPHIGWNALNIAKSDCPIVKYIKDGQHVYFVHSYWAKTGQNNVVATSEYGAPLTAVVWSGKVYGCQFHPEKSGNVGLEILRAFSEVSA